MRDLSRPASGLPQDQLVVLTHKVERLPEPHQQILGICGILPCRGHASDKRQMPSMAFLTFDHIPTGALKISLVKDVHFVLS